MGIVCDGRCPNNMECGAIVDYHCHKFQYLYQHEHAIVVAGFELECMLNHFSQKTIVLQVVASANYRGVRWTLGFA
jgi:hypothetical protein